MIEIRANLTPWSQRLELLAFERSGSTMSRACPLTWIENNPHERLEEPTMVLEISAAQGLMDELWRCGLRPSEGSGSAGSLAATERHLKDMQTVAMGLLRKEGVPI